MLHLSGLGAGSISRRSVAKNRNGMQSSHFMHGIEFFLALLAINAPLVASCALIELLWTGGVPTAVRVYPEVAEVRTIIDQKNNGRLKSDCELIL